MVRYSLDGKLLVSCADDKSVKVWDTATGALVRTLGDHGSRVVSIALLPDGKRLLSGTDQGELDLWDFTSGTLERQLEARSDWVGDIAVSGDGTRAITGNRGQPALWDLTTGRLLKRIRTGGQPVALVAFTERGPLAFTAPEKRVDVYDLQAGAIVKSLPFQERPTPRAISRDHTRLAIGTWDPNRIYLLDLRTWSRLPGPPGRYDIETASFSPDGDLLATAGRNDEADVWNLRTGARAHKVHPTLDWTNVDFSPDGRRVAFSTRDMGSKAQLVEFDVESATPARVYDGTRWIPTAVTMAPDASEAIVGTFTDPTTFWSLQTGAVLSKPATPRGTREILDMAMTPDGTRMVAGADSVVRLWDFSRNRYRDLTVGNGINRDVAISADGARFAVATWDRHVSVYESDTGRQIAWFGSPSAKEGGDVRAMDLSPDGKTLLWAWTDKFSDALADYIYVLRLSDVGSRRLVREFKPMGHIRRALLAPDGTHAVTAGARLILWNLGSSEPERVITEGPVGARGFAFLPGGDRVLCISGERELTVWNLTTAQRERSYGADTFGLTSIAVSADGHHAVTASRDGTARVYNLDNGESAALASSGDEWLLYTDDGYFDASRRGGSLVAVVDGMHPYSVDQLAARSNRPDVILQRLGLGSAALRDYLLYRHRLRLQRLGLTEARVESPFAGAPRVEIVDVTRQNDQASITFDAVATGSSLASYQVYVNEVPLFDLQGRPLQGDHERATAHVELAAGRNKIEIGARSIDGVESLRDFRVVDDPRSDLPDLHVLAFGVSRYRNPKYDLGYADKDARDLARVLKSLEGHGFGRVHAHVLTNDQVTVASLRQAKEHLAKARVNDTVVVFVAGHGLYAPGEQEQYYFLTHEVDLQHLAQTAAPFELVEDLVQGIAPRQKLLLVDACNSGERDPALVSGAEGDPAGARGIRPRAVRALALDARRLAAPGASRDLFDRDRYIYNDLLRRSGAVVFSSSRGTEYSYETDDLHNGEFTAAIVHALTSDDADANQDGSVSMDELRQYVSREVAKRTALAQHPTVDHDNASARLGFPIARTVGNEPDSPEAPHARQRAEPYTDEAPAVVAARGLALDPNPPSPARMCPDPLHSPVGCACRSAADPSRNGSAPWLVVAIATLGYARRRCGFLSRALVRSPPGDGASAGRGLECKRARCG
jgi:WD40 repeat protein